MTTRHVTGTPKSVSTWGSRLRGRVSDETLVELVRDGLAGTEVVTAWPVAALDHGEAWGEEVLDAAREDAEAQGARTTYVLRARTGERTIASRTIRADPSEAGPIEGPDPTGLLAQMMRHNEALVRQVASMAERTTRAMGDAMLALSERNAMLERERTALLERERERIAAEGEATVEILEAERKTQREERLFRYLDAHVAKSMADEAKAKAAKAAPPRKGLPNGKGS